VLEFLCSISLAKYHNDKRILTCSGQPQHECLNDRLCRLAGKLAIIDHPEIRESRSQERCRRARLGDKEARDVLKPTCRLLFTSQVAESLDGECYH
jgi:hypothetical protein